MSKRKSDIAIGQRAYEEVTRIFPGMMPKAIAKTFGCDRRTIYEWRDGTTPDGIYLQRLCFLGADIDWILTGRRKNT